MRAILCSFTVAVLVLSNAATNRSQQVLNEGSQKMSEEEQLVRGAYEKLVRYNRASFAAPGRNEPLTPDSVLRFELKNFHTGSVDEIKGALEKDVVTLPSGEVIRISHGLHTMNAGKPSAFYVAHWGKADKIPEGRPQWTLAELFGIQAQELFDVGKYTSYEATVYLQGKSRTYRALVIFHNLYESAQNPTPVFWDGIGADNSLNQVLNEKVPPLTR